jgi:hypothetical protein
METYGIENKNWLKLECGWQTTMQRSEMRDDEYESKKVVA